LKILHDAATADYRRLTNDYDYDGDDDDGELYTY